MRGLRGMCAGSWRGLSCLALLASGCGPEVWFAAPPGGEGTQIRIVGPERVVETVFAHTSTSAWLLEVAPDVEVISAVIRGAPVELGLPLGPLGREGRAALWLPAEVAALTADRRGWAPIQDGAFTPHVRAGAVRVPGSLAACAGFGGCFDGATAECRIPCALDPPAAPTPPAEPTPLPVTPCPGGFAAAGSPRVCLPIGAEPGCAAPAFAGVGRACGPHPPPRSRFADPEVGVPAIWVDAEADAAGADGTEARPFPTLALGLAAVEGRGAPRTVVLLAASTKEYRVAVPVPSGTVLVGPSPAAVRVRSSLTPDRRLFSGLVELRGLELDGGEWLYGLGPAVRVTGVALRAIHLALDAGQIELREVVADRSSLVAGASTFTAVVDATFLNSALTVHGQATVERVLFEADPRSPIKDAGLNVAEVGASVRVSASVLRRHRASIVRVEGGRLEIVDSRFEELPWTGADCFAAVQLARSASVGLARVHFELGAGGAVDEATTCEDPDASCGDPTWLSMTDVVLTRRASGDTCESTLRLERRARLERVVAELAGGRGIELGPTADATLRDVELLASTGAEPEVGVRVAPSRRTRLDGARLRVRGFATGVEIGRTELDRSKLSLADVELSDARVGLSAGTPVALARLRVARFAEAGLVLRAYDAAAVDVSLEDGAAAAIAARLEVGRFAGARWLVRRPGALGVSLASRRFVGAFADLEIVGEGAGAGLRLAFADVGSVGPDEAPLAVTRLHVADVATGVVLGAGTPPLSVDGALLERTADCFAGEGPEPSELRLGRVVAREAARCPLPLTRSPEGAADASP